MSHSIEYHKLIRNGVPAVIRESGREPVVHTATEDEYRAKLYEKLAEEVVELTTSRSLEEAADLQEVFRAICEEEGWSLQEVEEIRLATVKDRGTFSEKIILESVLYP